MGHKTDWGFKKNSILYMPQGEGNSSNNSIVIPYKKLQYHTSWDWLMPVVQKCRLDGQNLVGIDNWSEIGSVLEECNLDKTYQAVVEFINEYNQNK